MAGDSVPSALASNGWGSPGSSGNWPSTLGTSAIWSSASVTFITAAPPATTPFIPTTQFANTTSVTITPTTKKTSTSTSNGSFTKTTTKSTSSSSSSSSTSASSKTSSASSTASESPSAPPSNNGVGARFGGVSLGAALLSAALAGLIFI